MIGRLIAMGAAVAAAAAGAGAAVWAKRKVNEEDAGQPERAAPPGTPETPRPGSATSRAESGGLGDDLTVLKGIGAVSAERLGDIGVMTVAQIAGWTDADIDDTGARIKVSPERIRREDWVGQARRAIGD